MSQNRAKRELGSSIGLAGELGSRTLAQARTAYGRRRAAHEHGSRGVRLGYSAGAPACSSTRTGSGSGREGEARVGSSSGVSGLADARVASSGDGDGVQTEATLGDGLQAERGAWQRLAGGTRRLATACRQNAALGECFVWERGGGAIGSRDEARRMDDLRTRAAGGAGGWRSVRLFYDDVDGGGWRKRERRRRILGLGFFFSPW